MFFNKVAYKGRTYRLDGMVPSALEITALKKVTGLTLPELGRLEQDLFQRLADALSEPGVDANQVALEMFFDEAFLINIAFNVWLARRRAGERSLTFEEAADVPLDEFDFDPDKDFAETVKSRMGVEESVEDVELPEPADEE